MPSEGFESDRLQSQPSATFLQWRVAIDEENDKRCESLISHLTRADLPHVVALYNDDSENRRWWSVRALADLAGIDEARVLLRALEDPSADIRAAAAHCVARVAGRAWATERDTAALLLGALTHRLLDDLGFVRQSAADALAQLGEIAMPVLRQVLGREEDESARTRAAYALRKMQRRDAAEDFYLLLEDRNPMVRLYAREALEDMGLLEMAYFEP